ncbi:MAG: Gfo/Idh/MocA family oxidoreductase [Alkalinema sp. RU_4_3]|nr:Gfo/Idh/MocA family oxidoreductase [Alkalinema sp. RU_4_3]
MQSNLTTPIGIGMIGTGYAAKVRAEAINAEPRAKLVAIAGNTPDKTAAFAQTHNTQALPSWSAIVNHPDIQIVVIANLNQQHADIARAALFANKHVIVEYPLALDLSTAQSLQSLADNKNRLLHVEHIELLGGVHQALLANLTRVGNPTYARYATVTPQRPAPAKWTFHHEQFGFPLVGALSRLHRFTHAFGQVESVSCRANYTPSDTNPHPYYGGCLCSAQIAFKNGTIADIIYGKGETVWIPERKLEVQGDRGALLFDGDAGYFIDGEGQQAIEVASRRGLFARDTAAVLDHLLEGEPLYVTLQESLYTLKVAEATRISAESGQIIQIS